MSRCVACDYCDTVGEMSPYKWGLSVPNYSGRFTFDPHTGDAYCVACWIDYGELFEFSLEWEAMRKGIKDASLELDTMGGSEVAKLDTRNEGRDEEADNED